MSVICRMEIILKSRNALFLKVVEGTFYHELVRTRNNLFLGLLVLYVRQLVDMSLKSKH